MKVFVEDIFAGMELTESDWSRDFEVKDDDESQERTFEVVEGSLNVSHPSLEGLDDPFSAEPNEINNLRIVANFQPTNDMTGFFTFQVRAVDEGDNEAFADAQVVIIATENQIFLTFNNPIDYVTQYDAEIKEVFDSVFPYDYTRDDISSAGGESGTASKIDQTVIRCHFLDIESVPVLNSVVNAEYLTHYDNITVGLAQFALVLDQEDGFSYVGQNTGDDNELGISVLSIVLIIATIILAIMLTFTGITYCIRVTSLERRVKALGAGANSTSKEAGMDKVGIEQNVPGTNIHAAAGANPMWNIEQDGGVENPISKQGHGMGGWAKPNPLFDDGDRSSNESGDDEFVGVEDQDDFHGYAGKNQIDPSEDSNSNYYMTSDDDDEEVHRKKSRPLEISSYLRPALEGAFAGNNGAGVGGGNPLYQSDEEEA